MNVNLTPPIEPSKIASTAKSSAVSTDAATTEPLVVFCAVTRSYFR